MRNDKDQLGVRELSFSTLQKMFSLKQTTSVITGPCSIESREQMEQVTKSLVRCHIPFIRGGAYKPRTSP